MERLPRMMQEEENLGENLGTVRIWEFGDRILDYLINLVEFGDRVSCHRIISLTELFGDRVSCPQIIVTEFLEIWEVKFQ